jgi:hypothetical protein
MQQAHQNLVPASGFSRFAATLRYFVVNALAVDHDPARASRGTKNRQSM